MSSERISPGAQLLVADHIQSMTQLELLLLLHRDPAVTWSAGAAAAEMRFPRAWAEDQLERFTARGLLTSDGGVSPTYGYRQQGDHAAIVDELAELYRRRRTSLTSLIFAPARDDVRLLSEAFRIRRRSEDDY